MSWGGVYGHAAQEATLRTAFERGRLAHAYLFVGPSGIGKRRFAAAFAKALLCAASPGPLLACGTCSSCKQCDVGTNPDDFFAAKPEDKMELDIGTVREFAAHLGTKASRGGRKVGVLDDADDFNPASANVLLKTLEEPPEGTVLVLIATTEESQLPTILSRCQKVRFAPLPPTDLKRALLDLGYEDGAHVERLAALGGGSVEQAVALDSEGVLAFREGMHRGLADAKPDAVALASRWLAFNEEAGKEAKLRRPRAIAVIRMLTGFVRSAFAASLGAAVSDTDAARLATRVGPDQLADMLDALTEAERLIQRKGGLEVVIEQLLDRLTARQTAA